MSRFFSAAVSLLVALTPTVALAEGANGYSRGNAFMYFAAIAAVLIFGIHDIFRKRWVTIVSAIMIPIFLYLQLPAQ